MYFRAASLLNSAVRPAARRVTTSVRTARRVALPAGLALAVALATAPPAVQLQPAYERPSFEERLRPRPTLVITRPVAEEVATDADEQEEVPADAETLEEEAESAFDERTGEINWDCPCLGGMADGPCGEEFKAAFSCFVFSEADPKGIDCVDKFKLMQDCFRRHPEVYAEEIAADEAAEADVLAEHASAPTSASTD